ncbi:MAG: GspE/PulE family protein [Phycisphaerales bacterium]
MTPPRPTTSSRSGAPTARLQLGEFLIEKGLLTRAQLEDALAEQRRAGKQRLLGEVLVDLNFVSEDQVVEALAQAYGVPYAKLTPRIADPRVTDKLPREFIEAHAVLPLFFVDGVLTVAVSEPTNLFLVEEIERLSSAKVQLVAATQRDIRATLQAHLPAANVFVIDEIYDNVDSSSFSVVDKQVADLSNLEEVAGQSPVIKLVNFILFTAVQERASDIHIERVEHATRVRLRVDGRLLTRLTPPHQMHPAVVSRIKIMAGMDISERRLPQDGDIHVMLDGRPIDMRVSTMPAKHGEKVVIRVIDNRTTIVPLEKIGFRAGTLTEWRKVINAANGIVLVTGPTGSGKSTTLYATLNELVTDELNISTVENPVEATLQGVNQFQVNEKAGFTFPLALRSMLRQDPDILMVGEIRDAETAHIATQAALTGHLVFSTLHTNDAIAAATRLTNMGIEPYLTAAVLRAVLAQRLVRKICPHCKTASKPDPKQRELLLPFLADADSPVYHGAGCSRCRGKGFAGRLGIYELFVPQDASLDAIARGAPLQELRATALGSIQTLRDDGLAKVAAGQTTCDEIMRVLAHDASPAAAEATLA